MANGKEVADAVIRLNLTKAKLVIGLLVGALTIASVVYGATRYAVSGIAEDAAEAQITLLKEEIEETYVTRKELAHLIEITNLQYKSLSTQIETNDDAVRAQLDRLINRVDRLREGGR